MSTYETMDLGVTYCAEHAVERLIDAGEASPAARDMNMRDRMAQIDDATILRHEPNSGHCADCVDAKVARFLTLWDEAGLHPLPEPDRYGTVTNLESTVTIDPTDGHVTFLGADECADDLIARVNYAVLVEDELLSEHECSDGATGFDLELMDDAAMVRVIEYVESLNSYPSLDDMRVSELEVAEFIERVELELDSEGPVGEDSDDDHDAIVRVALSADNTMLSLDGEYGWTLARGNVWAAYEAARETYYVERARAYIATQIDGQEVMPI